MGDRIDDAISEVQSAEAQLKDLIAVPLIITGSGRPAILHLPPDPSAEEIIELASWLLLNARGFLAAQSSPLAQRGVILPPH